MSNNKILGLDSKKVIVSSFLAVPILASILSTLHIIQYLALGNHPWMSYALAVTFEVGSIASFVALSVLDRIKKGMVYFIFFILFFMQLVGNVYYSFDYLNIKLATDPHWLDSFIEMMTPVFEAETPSTYKFILALAIGVPVPLVSLSFLKSLVDYLKDEPATIPPVVQKPSGPPEPVNTADMVTADQLNEQAERIRKDAEELAEQQRKDHEKQGPSIAPYTNSFE